MQLDRSFRRVHVKEAITLNHHRGLGEYQRSSSQIMEERLADFLTFLIPASSAVTISFGGQLPLGEIIVLLLVPVVLVLRPTRIFQQRYKWPYILMAVWLIGELISDAYVGTSSIDRAKGVARIVFFALDLAVISALVGNSLRRVKAFTVGLVIMQLANAARGMSLGMQTVWKMWLFFAFSCAIYLFISRYYVQKRYALVWLSIVLLVAVSIFYGSRSAALCSLVVSAPLAVNALRKFGLSGESPQQQALRYFVFIILVGAAGWMTHMAIGAAVRHGLYNRADEAKFQAQSGGKLGVLFGGRPEGLVAIQAIKDSPIIGHGSYASNPEYTLMLQDKQYQYGYSDSDADVETDTEGEPLIPAHSHLTMAWIDGGVLGSLLWFYLLWLCGHSIFRLTEVFHPLAPLYCFFFISMFWDILFSPFGEQRRMQEAFYILLMFSLCKPLAKRTNNLTGSFRRGQPFYRRKIVRLVSPYRNLPLRPSRLRPITRP